MKADENKYLKETEPILDELMKQSPELKAYQKGFVEIAKAIRRDYKLDVTADDLMRQFMLAIKDELEAVPQSEWHFDNLVWFKDMEFKARERMVFDITRQIETNRRKRPE